MVHSHINITNFLKSQVNTSETTKGELLCQLCCSIYVQERVHSSCLSHGDHDAILSDIKQH